MKLIAIVSIAITFVVAFLLIKAEHNSEPEGIETPAPVVIPVKEAHQILPSQRAVSQDEEPVTDEASDSKTLTVVSRPDWKLDGPLMEHIERLTIQAEQGDVEAAFKLAMNLRYCYYSPQNQNELEEKLQEVTELSDGNRAIDETQARYSYCEGVNMEQRKQFYTYLSMSAENNHVPSQEAFGSITARFYMASQGYEDLDRDAFIEKRNSFSQLQQKYLEQASKKGSIPSLIKLAGLNRAQKLGANGYLKTFALNQVILELTQNNEIYNRYSFYQQKMYTQLKAEEIERAYAMADEWLESIRENGTLYSNDL